MTKDERTAFYASRNEAGLLIDPETAEVTWCFTQTLDPYGINRCCRCWCGCWRLDYQSPSRVAIIHASQTSL
jgi:hypothetical protein